MNTALSCHTDVSRREAVRAKTGWNGLDYLEVNDDDCTLTVYFLGKAPAPFKKDAAETAAAYQQRLCGYFRIQGGRRIRDIQVQKVEVSYARQADEDDYVEVTVDKPGDFSTYTLLLVGVPEVDPRYAQLDFTFKANCPSDLDCAAGSVAAPPATAPALNYLAKDYASFRQLILDRLALIMPAWQERHIPDIGIVLVELLAYVGDHLSYYQDAVGTEAYLDTARRRVSVRRHARLVDYALHEGCNARAWVVVEVESDLTLDPNDVQFLTRLDSGGPRATLISPDQLRQLSTPAYAVFEPVQHSAPLQLRATHNRLEFYTWDERECCLPKGTTRATLKYAWVQNLPNTRGGPERQFLKAGDVLIFEEVRGPKTGQAADADPTHRHAVRLTDVKYDIDPLNDQHLVEITWGLEDALPFALCLSVLTDAAHGCAYHENISVAWGNVILVDHGATIVATDWDTTVPTAATQSTCDCVGQPGEVQTLPGRYYPKLPKTPLTFSTPLEPSAPAVRQLAQDPRQALPQVWLTAHHATNPALQAQLAKKQWAARFDLLNSSGDDAHFVVEVDNAGYAHLRFGDGTLGYCPPAGTEFGAQYRVGNGPQGNVGAEVIQHLTWVKANPAGVLSVRNPLPAHGGLDPEPLAEAKLRAPTAFRAQLQRAITAEDYVTLTQTLFPTQVQRAAAVLRWNGSWYEAQVTVDELGQTEATAALLAKVQAQLYPYRRIGHDLQPVKPAQRVPLDICLNVCVHPAYLRGHVKAALLAAFSTRRLPNGQLGFFHPDQLTFGQGIYLSQLVAAAMAVPGVVSAGVTRLQRYGAVPNGEIENGVLALGPLEVAQVANDRSFPEHGCLELVLGGGR